MINSATFKIRIDSVQSYQNQDKTTIIGYCSFKFRDRGQDEVGQMEYKCSSDALANAVVGTVGVAIGSLSIYPPAKDQGTLNHRLILNIYSFEEVPAPTAPSQPTVPSTPTPPSQPAVPPAPTPTATATPIPLPV